MVEGQIAALAAILAGEAVAQEQVEPGEGAETRSASRYCLSAITLGSFIARLGAAHLALIMRDDVHPIQEHRLDAVCHGHTLSG